MICPTCKVPMRSVSFNRKGPTTIIRLRRCPQCKFTARTAESPYRPEATATDLRRGFIVPPERESEWHTFARAGYRAHEIGPLMGLRSITEKATP